jgi:phage terminase small subunit
MARPRKPTAVLELSGAFKKNPQRKRAGEPKESRPLGDPPDRLPKRAIPFWHEIVGMTAIGVLKVSDRWCVELAACLMAKAIKTHEGLSAAELHTLRSLLSAMGMTPADRSKMSIPAERPKNEFTLLAQESRNLREPA